ncbi:MAG TPA: hypothetical protein PKM88_15550 [bacterium]|nr:hypothetical protein [bacterium]
MKSPAALTIMRSMLRSKTQGNWSDQHLLAYLALGENEAYRYEIQADDQLFIKESPYLITGTGVELYALPGDFRQPILVRDTDGAAYSPSTYRKTLTCPNIGRVYFIINKKIGFPSLPTTEIEVFYHYTHTPMTTEVDSDLSDGAVLVAMIHGVVLALGDRGDVNVSFFEKKKLEAIAQLYKAKRGERNNAPLILQSPHLWDNV